MAQEARHLCEKATSKAGDKNGPDSVTLFCPVGAWLITRSRSKGQLPSARTQHTKCCWWTWDSSTKSGEKCCGDPRRGGLEAYWSENKALSPGAWCLICDQGSRLYLTVKEVQPLGPPACTRAHQAQEGQPKDAEILCLISPPACPSPRLQAMTSVVESMATGKMTLGSLLRFE